MAPVTWNATENGCHVGAVDIRRVVDLEAIGYPAGFLYPDATDAEIAELAGELGSHHFSADKNELLLSFHSFLVRTGRHTILVDLCCGNGKERPSRKPWHRRSGPFLDNLAAAGVTPEEVDIVMCTHLHADHVGWNTKLENGQWVPTFPNAEYLFAETEFKHWQALQDAGPAEPLLYGAYLDSVLPVIESGQARLVAPNHPVQPGVHMEPAFGHTPGNVVIHVEDGGAHAILAGDVLHHPVQLRRPEWSTHFCTDPELSRKTRMGLLADYADTATAIMPTHFMPPSYGAIRRDGAGYAIDE